MGALIVLLEINTKVAVMIDFFITHDMKLVDVLMSEALREKFNIQSEFHWEQKCHSTNGIKHIQHYKWGALWFVNIWSYNIAHVI